MSEVSITEPAAGERRDLPGSGKRVSIFGVPLGYGASMAGVDIGPAALRVARIVERVGELGYEVNDRGDLRLERPRSHPRTQEKLKYLSEIRAACEALAAETKQILDEGELPIIMGGDHSIAIGSGA